jgi:hypothetical protein
MKSDQWDPSKLGLEYAVSNFNDSKYIQFKRFVKQYIIYMMTKASYYCIGAKLINTPHTDRQTSRCQSQSDL